MSVRPEQQKKQAVIEAAIALAVARLGASRAVDGAAVSRSVLRSRLVHRPGGSLARRSLWRGTVAVAICPNPRSGQGQAARLQSAHRGAGLECPATVVEIVNDDMPFLVDCVTWRLNGEGVTSISSSIRCCGSSATATAASRRSATPNGRRRCELVMHVEISESHRSGADRGEIRRGSSCARGVACAVSDWRADARRAARDLRPISKPARRRVEAERAETLDFLAWLDDDNFTFLGLPRIPIRQAGEGCRDIVPQSGLGILRDDGYIACSTGCAISRRLPPDVRELPA